MRRRPRSHAGSTWTWGACMPACMAPCSRPTQRASALGTWLMHGDGACMTCPARPRRAHTRACMRVRHACAAHLVLDQRWVQDAIGHHAVHLLCLPRAVLGVLLHELVEHLCDDGEGSGVGVLGVRNHHACQHAVLLDVYMDEVLVRLDGLPLARHGALHDGARDEHNAFTNCSALKVAEVGDICGHSQEGRGLGVAIPF